MSQIFFIINSYIMILTKIRVIHKYKCSFSPRTVSVLPIHGQAVWNKLFQAVSFVFSDRHCIFCSPICFF
jgi:hypothetical protein